MSSQLVPGQLIPGDLTRTSSKDSITRFNEFLESEIEDRLKKSRQHSIGYPINFSYDYSPVSHFFHYNIINVGDSWGSSLFAPNTKDLEREVLSFFADLWGVNIDNTWAYLTQAGTEGNMQGLYVGREVARGKPVMLYTTKNSHYSIVKIARILNIPLCLVESQDNGEMNYGDFDNNLAKNLDKFVLVNINMGTTMRGACDDSREIYRIIKKHKKTNDFYIHVDGALSGFFIPFLESDTFFKAHIHSISISGHKFMGIPFPCGVFMMEKRFVSLVASNVEYIGAADCMISGSRNGHSAIYMKYMISKKGRLGFKADIDRCIELAEYLAEAIPEAWRNQNSITVVFPKPADELIRKWQLATEGEISHVVVMQHVTREMIEEFLIDYRNGIPKKE